MINHTQIVSETKHAPGSICTHSPLYYLESLATLKFYKCACATPHLHKISNLTKKIVSTGQFTFDNKVLKRYIIGKIVKQAIIWFSNMQIRYFKDLCEPCLSVPELDIKTL